MEEGRDEGGPTRLKFLPCPYSDRRQKSRKVTRSRRGGDVETEVMYRGVGNSGDTGLGAGQEMFRQRQYVYWPEVRDVCSSAFQYPWCTGAVA